MTLTPRQRAVVVAADGLVLFLGLYGVLFSFLSAFSLAVNWVPLLLACLGAGLAALLVFSLPKLKYRLPLVGLWLLFLLWMVWRNWDSLVYAALALAQTIGGVFAQKLGMGLVPPDLSALMAPLGFVSRVEGIEKITLLCMLLAALFALYLGWAVVRRRSFWLGLLVTFPMLLVPLSITLTPDWFPLTALLLFWIVGLLTRLPGRSDPYGGAKFAFIALPLGALLLTGLRMALPLDDYQQNTWARSTRMELISKLAGLGQNLVGGGLGSGLMGGSVEVNLAQAGPLRYTGKTILRVESETTGHIYLRGFSSATYTEKGWEQLGEEDYRKMREGWEVEGPNYLSYFPGMGVNFQPMNFPALADKESPNHRFAIENIGAATPYVYTPYQLSTTPDRMTGAEFVGDAYLARGTGIWRYVLYAKDKANPEQGAALTEAAAEAERTYRNFVAYYYAQGPEHLQETMFAATRDIMDRNGGGFYSGGGLPGASLYRLDAARMVADYLAEIAVYDPETPRTPEGEDFVDYFLTESRRGYCMHFASSATLILRALGVPARYVSGYTADVKAGQIVPVPDKNAHAWVEVYLDGYGWQPVEVTPGFSGDFPWSEPQNTATPSPTPTPSHSAPPTPPPSQSQAPNQPVEGERKPLFDLRPLIPVGAVLLLGWLMAARRQWTDRRRRARFEQADVNRAVIAMYLHSQRLLRYHPKEEMDAEVHGLGEKAKFSLHTLTEGERQRVHAYTTGLAVRTDRLLGFWHRLALRYILCLY